MRVLKPLLWGRLLLAAGSLTAVGVLSGWRLLYPLAVLLVLTAVLQPAGLRLLVRPRLWPLLLSPPLIGAFLPGHPDGVVGPLSYSASGLALGAAMSLRALCLLFTFQVALGGLSATRMIGVFRSRGLRGLGFALGVAQSMLATLEETSRTVLHTLRLRGGFRRRPLYSCRLFVVTVVSSTLRHGEDIVHAASARGFDPEEPARGRQVSAVPAGNLSGVPADEDSPPPGLAV
jgi:energy-coupling factor transporter transmembrane protein EcfT